MPPQNSKHYQVPFGNDANFVNHPGVAAIVYRYIRNLRNSLSTCGIFATSRLSRYSKEINAREYATAKFQTLSSTVWKRCQFCKSFKRCSHYDSTIFPKFLLDTRSSRSAPVRVHVDARNGHGRARGVGAAPRRRRSNQALQPL